MKVKDLLQGQLVSENNSKFNTSQDQTWLGKKIAKLKRALEIDGYDATLARALEHLEIRLKKIQAGSGTANVASAGTNKDFLDYLIAHKSVKGALRLEGISSAEDLEDAVDHAYLQDTSYSSLYETLATDDIKDFNVSKAELHAENAAIWLIKNTEWSKISDTAEKDFKSKFLAIAQEWSKEIVKGIQNRVKSLSSMNESAAWDTPETAATLKKLRAKFASLINVDKPAAEKIRKQIQDIEKESRDTAGACGYKSGGPPAHWKNEAKVSQFTDPKTRELADKIEQLMLDGEDDCDDIAKLLGKPVSTVKTIMNQLRPLKEGIARLDKVSDKATTAYLGAKSTTDPVARRKLSREFNRLNTILKKPKNFLMAPVTIAGRKNLELEEGMYVVKNQDGREKRFKSADSAEAKAFKASSSPKKAPRVAAEKYSKAWWERQEDLAMDKDDRSFVAPWDTIGHHDSTLSDNIDEITKEAGFSKYDDFTIVSRTKRVVNGVPVAGVILRVTVVYGKDDDMGLDGDVADPVNIIVDRDVKNPKKLVFAGYSN